MTATLDIRTHQVTGGGGVRLHVEETGDPAGRPVLFLHGLSQSRLAWNRQLHSDLRRDLRLVALDLRGHGLSERPVDAYGDPRLWADDVAAVIDSLGLDRPVLSGWSYGGVVIGDYLARHGSDAIGGVQLVCAVCRMGEPVHPFLGPDFVAVVPGLFSADAEESALALGAFGRLLTHEPLDAADAAMFFGAAASVPPRVRHGLLDRTVDHDAVYAALRAPLLVTHGLEDRVVLPVMADHVAALAPHARLSFYPGIGHAPFWEEPDRFNAELLDFVRSL